MDTTHMLISFGLTHQEAKVYTQLLSMGQCTGYEMAKQTGISRSNAYASLSKLVEKGGAHSIDGKPVRYIPVPVEQFCDNIIRNLQRTKQQLIEQLPKVDDSQDSYVTIRGSQNIINKIETMLLCSEQRVYISITEQSLEQFLPLLIKLIEQGRKVVVITDAPTQLPGATVYQSKWQRKAIRLITDSAYALTGELDFGSNCSCLYSSKLNLVELIKDSIKNEIRLIELSEE